MGREDGCNGHGPTALLYMVDLSSISQGPGLGLGLGLGLSEGAERSTTSATAASPL